MRTWTLLDWDGRTSTAISSSREPASIPSWQRYEAWVGFEGSIEINFYGLYKGYIGFIFQ